MWAAEVEHWGHCLRWPQCDRSSWLQLQMSVVMSSISHSTVNCNKDLFGRSSLTTKVLICFVHEGPPGQNIVLLQFTLLCEMLDIILTSCDITCFLQRGCCRAPFLPPLLPHSSSPHRGRGCFTCIDKRSSEIAQFLVHVAQSPTTLPVSACCAQCWSRVWGLAYVHGCWSRSDRQTVWKTHPPART